MRLFIKKAGESITRFSDASAKDLWREMHEKSPKLLMYNSFGFGGISRARTYDLHDVNVAL